MLGWLFGEAAEARQLNRDARSILESVRHGYGSETQQRMALASRRYLADAHERGGADAQRYRPIIEHFKTLHREARRARDDVELTACTLVIIYLRAEQIGAASAPARDSIDAWLADWAHVPDDRVSA